MKKNRSNLFSQIIKFLFVGGSAFVVDYLIYWVLVDVAGINYLIANPISFSVSVIYNYVLSVNWVFDVSAENKKTTEFAVFILLSIVGLGINQLINWFCVDVVSIHYMVSKIIATAVVMVFNFITRKKFLEK